MASRPAKLLYRFISSTGDQESIPQIVMAREDAKRCIRLLEAGKKLDINIQLTADTGGSYKADNVIAEIRGTELPEEIIIIGAHIDSWALGTGANDNGCNVAMMIDIARQMAKSNIQAKRTIRFALWNGEEQGYFGSHAYTLDHASELDQHKLAISIDIGSGDILGYFTNGRAELLPIMDEILAQVTQLGTFTNMNIPIVGTDNFDFMLQGVPNLVARHKPDLYGLNYHAASDTYDKVNLKSLKTNAAIVASTILQYANMSETQLASTARHDRNAVSRIIEEHKLEYTMKMFDVWNTWVKGTRGLAKQDH
jgi:carboxypeptidase Q